MSIQDTSSINPARTLMDRKKSTPQVTLCKTSEYLDQCLDSDAQITYNDSLDCNKELQDYHKPGILSNQITHLCFLLIILSQNILPLKYLAHHLL